MGHSYAAAVCRLHPELLSCQALRRCVGSPSVGFVFSSPRVWGGCLAVSVTISIQAASGASCNPLPWGGGEVPLVPSPPCYRVESWRDKTHSVYLTERKPSINSWLMIWWEEPFKEPFFRSLPQVPQGIFHKPLSMVPYFMIIEISSLCLSCKFLEGKGYFLISVFSTTHTL